MAFPNDDPTVQHGDRAIQLIDCSLLNLVFHLLVQLLDPLLQLYVQAQECGPPLTGVGRQRQSLQNGLPCVTPQPTAFPQSVIQRHGL